ncbi:MAG TPA: DinB family protein [Luteitalea sp.]|nr:DinB family protein [Luteitalea sp.]
MTNRIWAAAALLSLTTGAGVAWAQTPQGPWSTTAKSGWGGLKKNLAGSAAAMPEADYGFKPTPAVRTFGQLIGHLANDHFLICSAAKGEKNPEAATDFEKTTGKAALVKALNDSIAYCDAIYDSMTDVKGAESIDMFGRKYPRLAALTINVSHSSEHYGNLVTYLRLKGLTPPSSAGQ